MRILAGRVAALATIATILAACGGGGDGGTGNGGGTQLALAANGATTFSGSAGTALAGDRPSVKVTDASNGAPKAGVSVTFAVTGGSGLLLGATQTTNAEGIATVGGWTLGTVAGANALRASIGTGAALLSRDFTATGAAGAAARLVWSAQPPSIATAGASIGALQVDIADQFGNRVTSASNDVAVAFGSNPGATTLGGTTTVAASTGRASFGNLTISKAAPNYTLSATSAGLTAATSTFFTVNAATAAAMVKGAGDNQNGLAGGSVAVRPSVTVSDAFGNPVQGATVTFAVASGGGTVSGAVQQSSATGVATVGNWVLGTAGANTLTATITGGTSTTFTATAAAAAAAYNIDVRFIGATPDAAVQSAFQNAAARWGRVLGEVSNFNLGNIVLPANDCATGQPAVTGETIDDIIIWASIDSIDGPSNKLGVAYPCYTRPSTLLILAGAMVFDSADVRSMVNSGTLGDVIIHEMGHVIGIGSTWNALLSRAPVAGQGTTDTAWIRTTDVRYTGTLGNTEYFAFGARATGSGAPIENCGAGSPSGCGAGNWLGHWRETAFNNELMTGFVSASGNLLSRMSIAALQDLGYPVIMSGADTYSLPVMALFSGPAAAKFELREMAPLRRLREIRPDGSLRVMR